MPAELCVVTGAGRGIGAAVARRLAADGGSVVLVDRCDDVDAIPYAMATRAQLEAVAADCRALGAASVRTLAADASAPSFPAALLAVLEGRPAQAAVACAGAIVGAPGWETTDAAWDAMLDANLHTARRLAEAVVPGMLERGSGRFVAVASAAAIRAMPQLAAYSAAKSAVAGFVRALAADLAGTEVTANAVCPGSTEGEMLKASAAVYALEDQSEFAPHQLLRRVLQPDEIAAAIAWLCGPGGGAVTGAVIPVDGGLAA